MFDTSFAQMCLVISAAAVLMGRRETLTVSRYMGNGLGRLVGTLQGYRTKYESSAKDSALYEIQSTVRKELNELQGVSLDMSMVSSNRMTFGSSDSAIKKMENSSQLSGTDSTSSAFSTSGINSAFPVSSHVRTDEAAQLLKLSRLILADEQIRTTGKGVASLHDRQESGADIFSNVVAESILSRTMRMQQEESGAIRTPIEK